jgi:hypothetical protein
VGREHLRAGVAEQRDPAVDESIEGWFWAELLGGSQSFAFGWFWAELLGGSQSFAFG